MVLAIVSRELKNGTASDWKTVMPRVLSRDEALKQITRAAFKYGKTPEAISDGKKIVGYHVMMNDRVVEYRIVETQ
jgi:hypothetical protein